MRFACLTAFALAFPATLTAQDDSLLDRLRAAMELPVYTSEAREAGVPDERVNATIRDIFRSGVPADDAAEILDAETRTVREGGSRDNFGAYVRSQVESGVRGRALADAIHREHARRGMGKPDNAGRRDAAGPRDSAAQRGNARNPRAGDPETAGKRPASGRRPAAAGGNRQDTLRAPRRDTGSNRGRQP